jgi:hypothetical protein
LTTERPFLRTRAVLAHDLAVIVMRRYNLIAELDVLMLRRESSGRILQRADINNRLKRSLR